MYLKSNKMVSSYNTSKFAITSTSHTIMYNSISLQSKGVEDQMFLCLVQDNFLTQLVLEPTRAARVLHISLVAVAIYSMCQPRNVLYCKVFLWKCYVHGLGSQKNAGC